MDSWPGPQGLVELRRAEQNALQPLPNLLGIQSLLAQGGLGHEGLDNGVQQLGFQGR